MSDLAIVLVHYRTAGLLVEAVAALLRDLDSCHLRAEILVVDNGSEPRARAACSELPVRWLDPGENLGYAGGVRYGVEASRAEYIVAMNPDVVACEGCLGRLHAELAGGAAAAGPQFFWDHERRLRLPPTETRSAPAEVRAALARRFPALAGGARRAWRRHARRHWEATAPFPSTALSGALIAFRRDAWRQIGPFDEVFRLYFEETDWLLRLRAAGLAARFVPGAEAVHLFAQSSVQEPRSQAWFAAAEKHFRHRHYGSGVAKLLDRLAAGASARPSRRSGPVRRSWVTPAIAPGELATPRPATWVEVALAPTGFPAAGERLLSSGQEWRMPDEVWRRLPPGELWLRGVDASGRESAPLHLARDGVAEPA